MKLIGLIVLLVLAYFIWRFVVRGDGLVLITSDTGNRVTAVVKRVVKGKQIVIEINNNHKENRITEITIPRSVASQLGISEPAGFKVAALPLTDDDKKSQETSEFVEQFNEENLRWTGSFTLAPDAKVELAIPSALASPLTGTMGFQYETKVGFGGSISSFRVNLAEQDNKLGDIATTDINK